MSRGPLHGLLVVSLEQAVAAPLCSRQLADAGARVIKIERPEGDFCRRYDSAVRGQSAYFVWLNRGKESVVLDIRQPQDLALLRRMIRRCDVFIENLAPGAAARMGLEATALRAEHPRLVTCSISGYGPEGPYRQRKAYDLLVQAECGLADITGAPEGPGRVGISVVDIAAGVTAHGAILEALLGRAGTGEGAAVSISLFDAIAEWMSVPLLQYEYGGRAPSRVGVKHPTIAPYGLYSTRDGKAILVGVQNEREWVRFCGEVLQRPELAGDGRFKTNEDRVAHRPELDRLIQDAWDSRESTQLEALLTLAGVAYGTLNSVAGFAAHPHLRRLRVGTPAGDVRLPRPASLSDPDMALQVPVLGEHTESVRHEFAS
jgi:crotonobetainyl-CoA:carnitine CoA-transferase CaiB-like acyl-CoA transferase